MKSASVELSPGNCALNVQRTLHPSGGGSPITGYAAQWRRNGQRCCYGGGEAAAGTPRPHTATGLTDGAGPRNANPSRGWRLACIADTVLSGQQPLVLVTMSAFHPQKPGGVLEQLAASPSEAVRAVAASSPTAPDRLLDALAEYGTKHQPERPFFRKAISRIRQGEISPLIRAAIVRPSMTVQPSGAAMIGESAAVVVRSGIDRLDKPANKPSTIRQKSGSSPLIDHGEMRRGAKHRRIR